MAESLSGKARRVLVVNPVGTDPWEESDSEYLHGLARRGTTVDLVHLERGPDSLESAVHEAQAIPNILRRVLEKGAGYDGVLINCFLDPGVAAAREYLDVPVAGPGESGMILASMLGSRFSILSVLKSLDQRHKTHARVLGLSERLASVIDLGVPVLDLQKDATRTVEVAVNRAGLAIERDGAEVIVLGCTGLAALAEAIRKRLEVPVVEPLAAALKVLEATIDLGLTHSRAGLYRRPEPRKTRGYALPLKGARG